MREIKQGEQSVFIINLTETRTLNDGTKITTPYDLTNFTEIEVCFQVGSTIISKLQTGGKVSVVGPAIDGKITTTMLIADSAGFEIGNGDIEIKETKTDPEVQKFQLLGSFQIVKGICA